MSGPKRADVQAQLRVARNGQRQCAALIAEAERKTLLHLLSTLESLDGDATRSSREASKMLADLSPEMCQAASESLKDVSFLVQNGASMAQSIGSDRQEARTLLERADSQTRSADGIYSNATQALDTAEKALQQSGGHYLRQEMEQAKGATQLFNQAAQSLGQAAQLRQQAIADASQSVRKAEEAASTAKEAVKRVTAVRGEAQQRLAAQAEAKRIAEEHRRKATTAIGNARSAVNSLQGLPHQKFRPGAMAEIERSLGVAEGQLSGGAWDECVRQSSNLENRVHQLAREVAEAQREYERRHAESQSHLQGLLAVIEGANAAFIRQWSNASSAYDEARAAVDNVRSAMQREEWEKANALAQKSQETLKKAVESAAQNQTQNEVRTQVGEAVMDVLEELGFTVTSAPGSRLEPLRINAQTPDTAGNGDFDVSIPLSGEVAFHVETSEGDVSCVAAVKDLQDRLRSRGVDWNTTDWGHAQDAGQTEGQVKKQVRQQKHQVTFQTR